MGCAEEGIGKTVQVDKEVFLCPLNEIENTCDQEINLECFRVLKKVEIIIFAEVYENLEFQFVDFQQFHAMRCVVLITNDNLDLVPEDTVGDANVETCQFSTG